MRTRLIRISDLLSNLHSDRSIYPIVLRPLYEVAFWVVQGVRKIGVCTDYSYILFIFSTVNATIFSQFTSTTTICSTNGIDSCFDMVFLLDTDTALNTDITRLLQLVNQLPNITQNCVNR